MKKILCNVILFIIFMPGWLTSDVIMKVSVLGIFKPVRVIVSTEKKEKYTIQAIWGETMEVNGKKQKEFILKDPQPLTVEIPDKITRQFPGQLQIYCSEGKLIIVNHIPMEDYLASVVHCEIGAAPAETLKAQAILCRTKALEFYQRNKKRKYYISDLTDGQVYKGLSHMNLSAREAVNLTRDEVMSFKGKLATVFFCSTCAGETSYPGFVWKKEIEYIVPVKCEYKGTPLCIDSPHFKTWTWSCPLEQISRVIPMGKFDHIDIIERDEFGRVSLLRFRNTWNMVLKTETFRIMVGRYFKDWGLLKSARFKVEIKDRKAFFTGQGLGHGVGLCQWGAKKLGELGYKYRSILGFYFPRLMITDYYSLKNEDE
ncbi:MAG: SpoIID/LytB domain-containing protein [Spirochaetes bacterium]|nr:SpoIID/LytB domain-containing protein [Spirochaetota bacterium]